VGQDDPHLRLPQGLGARFAPPAPVAQNGRPDDRRRGVVGAVLRDRDFAFIKPHGTDGQPDVFMHRSKLQDGFAWDDLQTGMTVLYDLTITQKGQHRATAVWPLW
jgi:cold shock CspA family protein